VRYFGSHKIRNIQQMINLPTKKQFQELKDSCQCKWNEKKGGYEIIGPNGNSIFLPALGYRYENYNKIYDGGSGGYYWSSTESSSAFSYGLAFGSGYLGIDLSKSDLYFSVRLVQVSKNPASSQFMDLGLPSGTLWAKTNATKEYLNWHQAQDFVKKLNEIVQSIQALKNNP